MSRIMTAAAPRRNANGDPPDRFRREANRHLATTSAQRLCQGWSLSCPLVLREEPHWNRD
jgi:hypothetical protein